VIYQHPAGCSRSFHSCDERTGSHDGYAKSLDLYHLYYSAQLDL
jgi:hypothetical protein